MRVKKRNDYHGLTKETLKKLYIKLGMTDKAIADKYNIDRTAISHMKKRWGIKSRETIGGKGESIAIDALKRRGHTVEDMNAVSMTHGYDIKIDGHLRIEVKTSNVKDDGSYFFSLVNKPGLGTIESDYRFTMGRGQTKKRFDMTCDFMILVGIEAGGNHHFYIIPPSDLKETLQGIRTNPLSVSKYSKYKGNWDIIK